MSNNNNYRDRPLSKNDEIDAEDDDRCCSWGNNNGGVNGGISGRDYRTMSNVNTRGLDEGGVETTRRIAYAPSFVPIHDSMLSSSLSAATMKTTMTTATTMKATSTAQQQSQQQQQHQRLWNLNVIPQVPYMYTLESTSALIEQVDDVHDNLIIITPAILTERVENVLRLHSVHARYPNHQHAAANNCNSSNNNNMVKCYTQDMAVEFCIFLYEKKMNNGQRRVSSPTSLTQHQQQQYVIEVQRRRGTSIGYNVLVNDILQHVATGQTLTQPDASASSSVVALPLVVDDFEDTYEPDANGSLNMVWQMWKIRKNLLQHHHDSDHEASVLALNTLTSLTDPIKMGQLTANAISMALLSSSSSPHPVATKLFDLVLRLRCPGLCHQQQTKSTSTLFDDEDEDDFDNDHDELQMQRALAMTVLANATSFADANTVMDEHVRTQVFDVIVRELHCGASMFSTMSEELQQQHDTRVAVPAARLAYHLLGSYEHDNEKLMSLRNALEMSFQIGQMRNVELERWSRKCLDVINTKLSSPSS